MTINFGETESVIVSPSGSLLRFKSPVLDLSLLDSSLHLEDRPGNESISGRRAVIILFPAVPLESVRATVRNKPSGGG